MVLRAAGHARLAAGYCPRPVPNVVFVAPYLLEATLRFVEAAAASRVRVWPSSGANRSTRCPPRWPPDWSHTCGRQLPRRRAVGRRHQRSGPPAGFGRSGVEHPGGPPGAAGPGPRAARHHRDGRREAANFRDKSRMKDVFAPPACPAPATAWPPAPTRRWAVAEQCRVPGRRQAPGRCRCPWHVPRRVGGAVRAMACRLTALTLGIRR